MSEPSADPLAKRRLWITIACVPLLPFLMVGALLSLLGYMFYEFTRDILEIVFGWPPRNGYDGCDGGWM